VRWSFQFDEVLLTSGNRNDITPAVAAAGRGPSDPRPGLVAAAQR
jgi:hypothetical protein